MSSDQVISVREAADALQVSPQRIRQMIKDGQLAARRTSAGWLVPKRAVQSRARNVRKGRPPAPQTVWAGIALLAAAAEQAGQAGRADGPAQVVADRRLRHRVAQMLDALPDPVEDCFPWRRLLAARGHIRRLWVHPGVLDRVSSDRRVSRGGSAALLAAGEGLTGRTSHVELYARATDADALVREYRMRDDPEGQVTLVVVPTEVPAELAPTQGRPVPGPAAAADLLEEGDVRALHAAVHQLRSCQQALRTLRWVGKNSDRMGSQVPNSVRSGGRGIDRKSSAPSRVKAAPTASGR
jgi:excisionase family DNA binding protein